MTQHQAMDDQFEARLTAWLDDPDAETAGDKFGYKADGYEIAKKAIAEADSHETCARDDRAFTVLIGVTGADGEETVHEILPGTTLACVLGALNRDPDVAAGRVIGILKDEDEPELPDGIAVTSENTEVAVVWTPDDEPWPVPEPQHLAPASRAHWLPAARIRRWFRRV